MRGGVGSTESQGSQTTGTIKPEDIFGKHSNSKAANDLAMRRPQEYSRLKALARRDGIITY